MVRIIVDYPVRFIISGFHKLEEATVIWRLDQDVDDDAQAIMKTSPCVNIVNDYLHCTPNRRRRMDEEEISCNLTLYIAPPSAAAFQ